MGVSEANLDSVPLTKSGSCSLSNAWNLIEWSVLFRLLQLIIMPLILSLTTVLPCLSTFIFLLGFSFGELFIIIWWVLAIDKVSEEFDRSREFVNNSNKAVQKFRRSQFGQIQVRKEFVKVSYSFIFISKQHVCSQESHKSHWIPRWLHFTGLAQIPQGNFQAGPGLKLISPHKSSKFSRKHNLHLRSKMAAHCWQLQNFKKVVTVLVRKRSGRGRCH